MSACSNFTPTFINKDQCRKCSQKKDEHREKVIKVKANGWSCSSKFCIVCEMQSNDTIQGLILKIEQVIPCTKITHIMHDGIELNRQNSFADYKILDGTIFTVQTNTDGEQVQRVACMACSYHNVMYLSANIARGIETRTNLSSEVIKASIRQWFNMLDTNDQINIRKYLNYMAADSTVRFMVAIRDMLHQYVQTYRNTEYTNMIDFNYIELLDELRCPICFSRFSSYSYFSNIPVQLCTLSDKHFVCQKCFQNINFCPLCNGTIRNEVIDSKYVINLLETSMKKIEKYCFPMSLNSINIEHNQQPFAHGAFCNIFQMGSYAIKCPRVPAATGSDIERAIIHEIFLSRPLSHIPNILIVYGGIRLSNYGVCIVMEYVDGPSLATALDDGTILNLSFQERLNIALGICKGLGELHLTRIVHRDFKPANVLLQKVPVGHGYIPKIADFGVSFLIQTASATAVKNSGGTVGYDAPEVADGSTPSIQSDIYALAFTLYELLTVRRPFAGYKDSQIIRKFTVNGERPTDWSVNTADRTSIVVPAFLKHTIEKGWSIEPEDRARIGEIICALRKSMNPDYQRCPEKMFQKSNSFTDCSSSYDFMDKFDSFELLAIQEIIKRLIIDDSEAIERLINHYALC